ncbi:MAG TPA: hypothetical protein VMW56_23165 [Candidatus Margulisiibacteriota bacterium]|nr:hypothetical protein [Candidatus Margulisiibacteriota bacterium]
MSYVRWLVVATAIAGLVSTSVHAQDNPECLVSLSATGSNATVSRGGRMISGTPDSSGNCTFTLTACVDDTADATCTPGPVNSFRIQSLAHDSEVAPLQEALQARLPATERTCEHTTVTIPLRSGPNGAVRGQRRIRAQVTTADGRRDADSLLLLCQCSADSTSFKSTFEGIQKSIFEAHGCTNDLCHGSAKQNGLDLRADAAYQNLIEVPSVGSQFPRVVPGDQNRSYLWLKVAAKTAPDKLPQGVVIPNPMPQDPLPALSADELEALRLWIYSGAPQTGTVPGTESLLNACLPPAEPLTIKPLDPPAAGTGIQFVMPPWHLEAHSEHELCFATYYDISAQVPKEFQDPTGTMFRFSSNELRQDPQSHHLILNRYFGSADDIHDPSFGAWTCNGGDKAGQTCEPTDLTACGSGTCTSEIKQSFACIGFGPGGFGQNFYAIGGAQKAQATTEFADTVFAQVPMKGILYWNSHAFNLTDQDTTMHARLNYYFAKNPKYPVGSIFDTSKIFAASAAPYKTQTVCQDFLLPQGARLFSLSSHTHRHGKDFTIKDPSGKLIYESFVYNDPLTQTYNPALAFDSADPKQRTLHYCSFYNNGVAVDGTPDPNAVTRRSRLPQSAQNTIGLCSPVACAAGKIGAPCRGVGDDRTCDTAAGANDGLCDACPLTGGESTENEMFILIGSYYVDTMALALANGGGAAALALPALDATGRSTSTEVALPPQLGCGASHAAHAMHLSHAAH